MRWACMIVIAGALLSGCGGPKTEQPQIQDPTEPRPVDPRLIQYFNNARFAFDQGQYAQAARLYEQALERARQIDDAKQIGNAAYNLAATRMSMGEYDAAAPLLREAEQEMRRAGQRTADVQLVAAELARRRDRPDEAEAMLRDLLASGDYTEAQRRHAWLTRGLIAIEQDRLDDASAALREAEGLGGETALEAQLRGRIAFAESKPVAAAEAFDREAALARQRGQYDRMERATADAGAAWLAADQYDDAFDRLYRAARMATARGDQSRALSRLDDVDRAAQASGDATQRKAIEDLRTEITGGP